MQGYCDVYKWTILKRTSPEVKCLHLTSSRREMCTLCVSNVIYHKFSHGAAFYTLNGKNVNVMLEFAFVPLRSVLKRRGIQTFVMRYEYYDYVKYAEPGGYKYKVLYFHHHESLNNERLKDTSLLTIARKLYHIYKI